MWARVAAESALAGGIGLLVATVVFAGLAFVATTMARRRAASSHAGAVNEGIFALMTRAPFVAVMLLAGAAALLGVLPGVGADLWFDVYRGLGQHGGMGWTLGVVAAGHVCLGVGLTRRLLVALDAPSVVESEAAPPVKGSANMWAALLAGLLVAGGPLTGIAREMTMAAASGVGLVPGSERRERWARAVVASPPDARTDAASDAPADAAAAGATGAPATQGAAPATRR
jgi:hypothetical protein